MVAISYTALIADKGVTSNIKPIVDVDITLIAQRIIAPKNDNASVYKDCAIIDDDFPINLYYPSVIKYCVRCCHGVIICSNYDKVTSNGAMDVNGANAPHLYRAIDEDR